MPERLAGAGVGGTSVLVGVDVGGTSVKVGAITPGGEVLAERQIMVDGRSTDPMLDEVAEAVREVAGGSVRELPGLGLGVPGLLDRAEGRVLSSPNLPWIAGVRVRSELARRLGLAEQAVRLENDANVAALGEQWLGGARGVGDMLLVTLGTGIGGGLILGGRLFTGEHGMAGEIGHVKVAPDGLRCGCGQRGCLETLASASAARRRALELGLPPEKPGSLRRLSERARAEDGPERALLRAIGRDLGHGLAAPLSLLDVRTYVFGGGFSAALDTLRDGIRAGLDEWAFGGSERPVQLVRATLGPSAGWIGAARLVL